MGILWEGKKQILGKPWTFTKYSVDEEMLYVRKGMLAISEEQVALYRIIDISMQQTLLDRLFNQGTLILNTTDANERTILLEKISNPSRVKNIINNNVEKCRRRVNISTNEYYNPAQLNRMDNRYDEY